MRSTLNNRRYFCGCSEKILEEVLIMKNKIKEITNRIKQNEKGALVVEAAIVFPVMFFVLFFIIFIGNLFFEQARVDDIVMRYAVEGAQCVADPFLYDMEKTNAVPSDPGELDLEPYRYILGSFADGSISAVEDKISSSVKKEINNGSLIFFQNSKANYIGTDNKKIAEFNNYILYSTFVVQVNYEVKFPIRFFGRDNLTIAKMSARSEVAVSDTDEFIRNVDMAVDLLAETGLGQAIGGIFQKVGSFINSFASK